MSAALEALVNQGGVLGALVVVFALVIGLLWRDGRKREAELHDKIEQLQQLRVNDAAERERALALAVEQSTTAIERMADASQAEAEAIADLQVELTRRRR